MKKPLFSGHVRAAICDEHALLVLSELPACHAGSVHLFILPFRRVASRLERREDTLLSNEGLANWLGLDGNGNGEKETTGPER